MDFELDEQQQALIELADRILRDLSGHERLAGLEADSVKNGVGTVHDAHTWRALADAGVIGAVLPEPHGSGLGFLGLALLSEVAGRHVAYLPVVATLALGALPIARYGDDSQLALLEAVAAGRMLLTAALEEPGEPRTTATTARRDGDGWIIDGAKSFVPYGDLADRLLVPAMTEDGVAMFVVDRSRVGVTSLRPTGRTPTADLVLDGVRAESMLGDVQHGDEIVEWTRAAGCAALACEAAGVCAEALRITAAYTSERKQFGEAIGSFQAVGQRAADAYTDTEVLRLTAYQAAWRLDADWPYAAEVATAKFHAGDAGSRVLHACQHLHGGIGVDLDYPIHRYFLRGKQIEHTLGTSTRQLLRLGAVLTDSPR